MSDNHYIEEIQALKEGKIETIVVSREAFIRFREAWLQTEDRTAIVGEAGLNGQIIYRFVKLNK